MNLDFKIEDFKRLYCDMLMSKEDMIRELNITEYIHKKIIKEFGLLRCKTNKINRFKANNGITLDNIKNIQIKNNTNIIEVVKTEKDMDNIDDKEQTQDLINKVKSTLQNSRKTRTLKKY